MSLPHLRRRSRIIALVGTVLVLGYAAFAAVQILVLNPLAAVPGSTLAEIHRDLGDAGESLMPASVFPILGIGVVLALVFLIRMPADAQGPRSTVIAYAVLLMLGAPGYFLASFGAGMALADTYGISGADASSWSMVLFVVSVLSSLTAAALTVDGMLRARRARPSVAGVGRHAV